MIVEYILIGGWAVGVGPPESKGNLIVAISCHPHILTNFCLKILISAYTKCIYIV